MRAVYSDPGGQQQSDGRHERPPSTQVQTQGSQHLFYGFIALSHCLTNLADLCRDFPLTRVPCIIYIVAFTCRNMPAICSVLVEEKRKKTARYVDAGSVEGKSTCCELGLSSSLQEFLLHQELK